MAATDNMPATVIDLDARRARRRDHATPPPPWPDDDAPLGEGAEPALDDVDAPIPKPTRRRRPVMPGWAANRTTAKATAAWASRFAGHVVVFHTIRAPIYTAKIAARSPIGVGRIVASTWSWVFDRAYLEAHRDALSKVNDPKQYLNLRAERRQVIKYRSIAALIALGGLAVVVRAITARLDPDWRPAAAAAAILLLGIVGRRRDAAVVENAAETAHIPPLTADLITTALTSLGVAGINAAVKVDPRAIRYLSITRDGAGFRADIELPVGVTAGQVIERRAQLASGLRRQLGCVWPGPNPDGHEGHLILYVADKPLTGDDPKPWPLAKTGAVNVFEPFPLGTDERGRPVLISLMYAAGLIGALPRMGKSAALRLILLACSLDPRVEIHAYDFKGTGDLAMLEPVAYAHRTGDDPEDMEFLLRDLKAIQADMRRRAATLRALPKDRCPENKVTDELANDRSLSLHPVVLALDETQIMFEHPQHGAEFEAIVTDLIKRGPALGIMIWSATQRPDHKSIPRGVSSNAAIRLCFKVMGHIENDMVLGQSMFKAGYKATEFGRKDQGLAYMAGEGDDPVLVRVHYIDVPAAEIIVERAYKARHLADRLPDRHTQDEDTDRSTVIDHLLAVWPADQQRVWCDELATLLREAHPAKYGTWTGANITAAVKPHDVTTVQVKRAGANRRGLDRADLLAARGV